MNWLLDFNNKTANATGDFIYFPFVSWLWVFFFFPSPSSSFCSCPFGMVLHFIYHGRLWTVRHAGVRFPINYRPFIKVLSQWHLWWATIAMCEFPLVTQSVCFSRGLEVLLDRRAERARYVDSTWVKSWDYVAPHGCDFLISGRRLLPPLGCPNGDSCLRWI